MQRSISTLIHDLLGVGIVFSLTVLLVYVVTIWTIPTIRRDLRLRGAHQHRLPPAEAPESYPMPRGNFDRV